MKTRPKPTNLRGECDQDERVLNARKPSGIGYPLSNTGTVTLPFFNPVHFGAGS